MTIVSDPNPVFQELLPQTDWVTKPPCFKIRGGMTYRIGLERMGSLHTLGHS